MVRTDISISAFNEIRRKKKALIERKKKDRRIKISRITDAYILDIMLKENGRI